MEIKNERALAYSEVYEIINKIIFSLFNVEVNYNMEIYLNN